MKLTKFGITSALMAAFLAGCGSDSPSDTATDDAGASAADDDDVDDDDAGDGTADDDATDDDDADDDTVDGMDGGAPMDDGGIDIVNAQSTDGGDGVVIEVPDAGEIDAGPQPTVSLSGQIRVSDRLFLDADVKNTDVLVGSNGDAVDDDFQDVAQEITSPSQVAGYVGAQAVEDITDDGDLTLKVDNVDYYRVQLEANQPVTLVIAEPGSTLDGSDPPPAADLDLYLLDANSEGIFTDGTWVDDSTGIGDKEQVIAPVTGTYFVAVERYQDADDPDDDELEALYTLSVGIRQGTDEQEKIANMVLSSKFEAVPNQVYLETEELDFQVAGGTTDDQGKFKLVTIDDGGEAARGDRDPRWLIWQIKKLAKLPGVKNAFPNYIYHTSGAPIVNDPLYGDQWHYEQIDVEAAWENTDLLSGRERGTGVVVAVIDTGVAVAHPDFVSADGLTSQLTTDGIDMISFFGQDGLPDLAVDGDGIDNDPNDPGDGRTPGDHSFHGTHCSGTIAAATNNAEGGSGVAPLARIMPIRALGRGGGTTTDIAESIKYAAGVDNASGQLPDQPAHIISMSLGGPRSPVFQEAVDAARAAGTIVIAAAGNETSPVSFVGPASHDGVVAVSATDFNKDLAFYSNFGPEIDVAAPGGDTGADANLDGIEDGVISMVFKNNGNTRYVAYQGTSMATPHVAGVAALMKSVWPEMGPEEFDSVLQSGEITVDIGDSGRDDSFGVGLINANKAVVIAAREAEVDLVASPVLSVSTTVLDFGGDGNGDMVSLGISNNGPESSTLTIDNVTIDQSWVTLAPGEEGDNTVTVDRSDPSLQAGVNSANITIESNGGTATIDVRLFQGEEPSGGNLDIIYVLLVNPADGTAQFQEAAFSEVEEYSFTIADVTPGKYYLVAGTDMADTTFLGDDGNAYGAFPLAQDPLLLCINQDPEEPECREHVTENRDDVNFGVQILTDKGAEFEADPDQEVGMTSAGGGAWRIQRLW